MGGYPAGPVLAHWGQRALALLIDVALVLVPYVVLSLLGASLGRAGVALAALADLGAFGFSVWNLVFRQGSTGQTIGKEKVGIMLVSERDGHPIGAGLSFVRCLAHILDELPCYLGYFWPLWDTKRQTFADKVMGTIVVKL